MDKSSGSFIITPLLLFYSFIASVRISGSENVGVAPDTENTNRPGSRTQPRWKNDSLGEELSLSILLEVTRVCFECLISHPFLHSLYRSNFCRDRIIDSMRL